MLGAVQVPPDGQPVVLLADHPATGGYPVVGVVHPDDLWQCGQLRPGEQVTLHPRQSLLTHSMESSTASKPISLLMWTMKSLDSAFWVVIRVLAG